MAPATALIVDALARRQWLNVGLLGLAGGLAALALFERSREWPEAIAPLLDLVPARIERIEVERANRERLVFERRAGRWWMTAPTTGPANPVLLGSLSRLAEARCPLRYAADRSDLRALGLDPPDVRVWLDGREVRFGATAPTDGRRYLRVDGTVHLCPDDLYPLLTSGAGSFLAKPLGEFRP